MKHPDQIIARLRALNEEQRDLLQMLAEAGVSGPQVAFTLEGGPGPASAPPPRRPRVKKITAEKTDGAMVFEAFSDCYWDRYGCEPVRNAMVNANCAGLVRRLGLDDALSLVRYYLSLSNAFYVRNSHTLRYCLRDCESLMTQMKTQGEPMTASLAQETERKWTSASASREFLARKYSRVDEI